MQNYKRNQTKLAVGPCCTTKDTWLKDLLLIRGWTHWFYKLKTYIMYSKALYLDWRMGSVHDYNVIIEHRYFG